MTNPMTGDQLRELQRPIKDRYGDDPSAAEITLEADGSLDEDIACSVQTGTALVKEFRPGPDGFNQHLTVSNGILLVFTTGVTGDLELWTSDGTPEGTILLKEFAPEPNGSNFALSAVNGALLPFGTSDPPGLWRGHGTPETRPSEPAWPPAA